MMDSALINENLNKLLGVAIGPTIFKIEEGAIQRYATAIGDTNPMFNDVGYAKKSKYGGLICPPGFFGWPVKEGFDPLAVPQMLLQAGAPERGLDGGIEYEFFEIIRAGDTLSATTSIINIQEKESKSGKMLITTIENTYINQDGELVMKSRSTLINR